MHSKKMNVGRRAKGGNHRLKRTTISVILTYLFSGTNLLVAGVTTIEGTSRSLAIWLIVLGSIMLFMVPISALDPRKEMHSITNAVFGFVAFIILGLIFALSISLWWITVITIELTVYITALIIWKKLK